MNNQVCFLINFNLGIKRHVFQKKLRGEDGRLRLFSWHDVWPARRYSATIAPKAGNYLNFRSENLTSPIIICCRPVLSGLTVNKITPNTTHHNVLSTRP